MNHCRCALINIVIQMTFTLSHCRHVYNVDDYLYEVDKNLVRRLEDPVKNIMNGFDIFDDVNYFDCTLNNIIKAFKKKDPLIIPIVQFILDGGFPKFVKKIDTFDFEKIKKIHNWENGHVFQLKELANDVKYLYIRLNMWCKKYSDICMPNENIVL